MPRILFLSLLLLLIASRGYAQVELSPELLQDHTYYFSLNNGVFSGADSLLHEIEESHFIALGELHNRQQLSRFTTALLNTVASFGFQYLAVETGPYSAEKLEQLIAEGTDRVSAFYDEYSYLLFNITPIPFFTGQADLEMLAMAHREGYDLWGIDQEFAFAPQFLIDELAETAGQDLTGQQEDLQSSLGWDLYWMQFRAQIFSSYDLACRLRDSEDLQTYIDSFDSNNPEVAFITEALMTSLEIYCMYESGNYRENNQTRIAYFKSNFDKCMTRAMTQDSLPKVILKMGSYHSGRERSPLNYYDIGNHLQAWADSLGTQSLHIRFLNRYIDGEDMMENENYTSSRNFMSVGKTDRWAVIDLRPLRRMAANKSLDANAFETREIINYDLLLIMPDDSRAERHY
ncbi:MAG: hypothetical protein GVY07_08455 [Bacteroidetes bacterium]|nr:hypothetical protein [Bacteroidota bacterium]